MGHNEGHGDNGKFDDRTFVYIRTNPADDGTEPLPPNLPCWVSPDITIIQPGGIRGGEAVAGQLNQVEVIVTNAGGLDAIDAYVEAFVADPSTSFTPATATLVGGDYLSIPGYNTGTIAFPWTPLSADVGHRCLLARVCLLLPPDCYKDPTVFDVVGDRHVAQRNISVIALTDSDSASFRFLMTNPRKKRSEFVLRAREIKVGPDAGAVRRALGCWCAQFAEAPLADLRLGLGEAVKLGNEPDPERRFQPSPWGVLKAPVRLAARKTATAALARDEVREAVVTLSANLDVRPGDLHIVEIAQLESRTKQVVGGLWLVVHR